VVSTSALGPTETLSSRYWRAFSQGKVAKFMALSSYMEWYLGQGQIFVKYIVSFNPLHADIFFFCFTCLKMAREISFTVFPNTKYIHSEITTF
jgi:hypothetical protein